MMDRGFLPSIGINIRLGFFMGCNLVVPMRMAWWIDHAGVVSTIRQHECHIGMRQHLNLINRTPRGHVIRQGAHSKDGYMDIAQRDRTPADLISPFCQIIIEEEAPRYFDAYGKACAWRRNSTP